MKDHNWEIFFGLSLIILSSIIYFTHYLIFGDPHHIFIYLVGDIAFLPIEVLFVTLIIHRLLSGREKRIRLEKLNMIIESFYSELGTKLIAYFSDSDPKLDKIKKELIVTGDWSDQEFSNMRGRLVDYDFGVEIDMVNLEDLRTFLLDKRAFLISILKNPSLLEHEFFTNLLRAVLHLTEELAQRHDLTSLPASDREHLSLDIKRAYILLVRQWLDYMKYLKDNYPYLFSLAMRTNPFDEEASPIVK